MQKIGEIKSEIQAAEPGEYAALFEKYKEDTRSGVRKLLEQLHKINILQATYEAMREAVSKLEPMPQILLNDAVTIPDVIIPQVPIIKGDAKSISIAAASIVAKVTRDRMMVEYDKVMPEYGFASNKGYGAAAHIEALKKYGPSPIHRATFIKNFIG